MKLDHTPQYAFGIKHSPYLGTLKGDAWGGNKTEISGIATRKSPVNVVAAKPQNAVALTNGNVGSTSVTSHTTSSTQQLANGGTSSSVKTVSTAVTKGHTTTSTRVHSDGHRIRTETFSYTKGPTVTTSKVSANRTTTTETKAIA